LRNWNRNSTVTIMGRLERRVDKLEAMSGKYLSKHIVKMITIPGGPVDTTGWKEVLRSENDNGSGIIFQHYEIVPPDEEKQDGQ